MVRLSFLVTLCLGSMECVAVFHVLGHCVLFVPTHLGSVCVKACTNATLLCEPSFEAFGCFVVQQGDRSSDDFLCSKEHICAAVL